MNNKIRSLFALSLAALLASCGGGTVTPSSDTSSAVTSDTSESSSATSETSSDSSSSSLAPVSDVFNTFNAAYRIAQAIAKYVEGYNVQTLLDQLAASGEAYDLAPASEAKVTEGGVTLLLYYALKDNLPARIGARSFQGVYFDPDGVELRKFNDNTKNGVAYKALQFLSQTGIFTVPATTSLSNAKALGVKNLNKYLDRVHAYFGESYVDDFFSTVNHDYLYDDNPYEDRPSDGRATWEETYSDDTAVHTYDSRLIPEEDIVDFALPILNENPSGSAFLKTYLDFDARATGNAAGLVAGIQKYLDAETPAEFIEVCREMAKKTGFCILWSETSTSQHSYGGKRLLTVTSYNNSATSSEAISGRATSVSRFSPIFQEVLGNSEAEAKKFAEDYSDFKIELARHKENDTEEDAVRLVTESQEDYDKYPKLYTMATFSTGETLQHFFESLGFGKDTICFTSSKDIRAIVDLINENTLDYVKGMAVWQMLQHYTICLPDTPAVNAWAWKPGYGTNKATLWDRKEAFYTYGMPYLNTTVSNLWVNTPAFEADHEAVVTIVSDLKSAMLKRIKAADWLSQDAKDKAKLKIDNMKYCVGGKFNSGNVVNYDVPVFAEESLFSNIGASEALTLENDAVIAGSSTSVASFESYVTSMNPLEANAFYMPALNGIDITLGFMACYANPKDMTRAELVENYGWVVGHEISHGFDSNGILYDETGAYQEDGWFLPADQKAYEARCKSVANYYDGYETMPGTGAKGSTVITEAIADINGLTLAMEVAKGIEGFDYQKFFIGQAKHFASYASQYTYKTQLLEDEHPFGRARVNLAVMTSDEFHETFGTKEGDNMYVAPEDRIRIW